MSGPSDVPVPCLEAGQRRGVIAHRDAHDTRDVVPSRGHERDTYRPREDVDAVAAGRRALRPRVVTDERARSAQSERQTEHAPSRESVEPAAVIVDVAAKAEARRATVGSPDGPLAATGTRLRCPRRRRPMERFQWPAFTGVHALLNVPGPCLRFRPVMPRVRPSPDLESGHDPQRPAVQDRPRHGLGTPSSRRSLAPTLFDCCHSSTRKSAECTVRGPRLDRRATKSTSSEA